MEHVKTARLLGCLLIAATITLGLSHASEGIFAFVGLAALFLVLLLTMPTRFVDVAEKKVIAVSGVVSSSFCYGFVVSLSPLILG